MRVKGFEPSKALSHRILSPTHLTTLAHPHTKITKTNYIKTFRIDIVIAPIAQLAERQFRKLEVTSAILVWGLVIENNNNT